MKDLEIVKKALNDFAKQTKQKQIMQDRTAFIAEVSKDIIKIFQPLLVQIANQSKLSKSELTDIAEGIAKKINIPEINIPDLIIPDFPEVKVPTPVVNYTPPAINIPDIQMPDKMNVEGWVRLMGVDLDNPLPVQLRDAKGKPVNLFENLTTLVSGGGGIGIRAVKINNTSDNPVPVSGTFTVSGSSTTAAVPTNNDGLTYNSDNPLPVTITSGASATTAVQNLNADGTYRDTFPVEGTVTESNSASILSTLQTIDDIVETEDTAHTTGDKGVMPLAVRNDVLATLAGTDGDYAPLQVDADGALYANIRGHLLEKYTGVDDIPNTLLGAFKDEDGASAVLSVAGHYFDGVTWDRVRGDATNGLLVNLGSNNDISGTVAVSGVTGTIGANIVDSSGVAYSSSNPIPIDDAGGAITVDGTITANLGATDNAVLDNIDTNTSNTATAVQVMDDWDETHDSAVGNDGALVMAEARTTNPTAVADGDATRMRADKLGRQIMRPVQVRDLIATAYVSKTSGSTFGTETTLYAGATNTYHDLIYVLASNDSTTAIGVDIRGTTGGNVLMHLEIPANGVVGISTPVPLPAGDVGASWTIDLPDVTGTNVYVTAQFSKEV